MMLTLLLRLGGGGSSIDTAKSGLPSQRRLKPSLIGHVFLIHVPHKIDYAADHDIPSNHLNSNNIRNGITCNTGSCLIIRQG